MEGRRNCNGTHGHCIAWPGIRELRIRVAGVKEKMRGKGEEGKREAAIRFIRRFSCVVCSPPQPF